MLASKRLIVLIVCLMVTFGSSGQGKYDMNDFQFGLRVLFPGICLGNPTSLFKNNRTVTLDDGSIFETGADPFTQDKFPITMGFEGTVLYNLGDNFSLLSGIGVTKSTAHLFSRVDPLSVSFPSNQSSFDSSQYAYNVDLDMRTWIVNIPMDLRLYIDPFVLLQQDNDVARFYTSIGFELNKVLVNRGDILSFQSASINRSNETNVSLDELVKFKSVFTGLRFGLGLSGWTSNGLQIELGMLYRHNFKDITQPLNNAPGYRYEDGEVRYGLLGLALAVYF